MTALGRLTRGIHNVRRLAEIVRVLVRHGLGEAAIHLRLLDALPARLLAGFHIRRAPAPPAASRGERLRAVLTELGPTYVKLGQVLSTRPDLIPPDICADLAALQEAVPPFPGAQAAELVTAELGRPPAELFAHFDLVPTASASISQVHRATLKDGTAVAVKIQRPGIAATIAADIELLESLAAWMADHGVRVPGFDPVGAVREYARSVRRELDFTHEARVAERFARNFHGCDFVHFPVIHRDLCTPRILTMEWIAGKSLRDLAELRRQGHDLPRIARHGVTLLLRQVFEHGLFHADPHPGNIFVLPGEVICLLDYGMVGQLMPEDTERLADLLAAVFRKDTPAATTAVLEAADITGPVDRRALERELHEFIAFEAERIMAGVAFGEALGRVIAILRQHGLALPARYILLIKALATMEQVAHDLDPTLDVAVHLRPYVERLIRRRYSSRRVLRDLTRTARALLVLGRTLPTDVHGLLVGLDRDGLKVALRPEDLQLLTHARERSASWITFGLIIGALIVGSSLVLHRSTGPTLLGVSLLGLVGYILATVLGLGMVFSMWRARRF